MKTSEGSLQINFLVDTGAQLSLIDSSVVEALQLKSPETFRTTLSCLDGIKSVEGSLFDCSIRFPNDESQNVTFYALPNLQFSVHAQGAKKALQQLEAQIPISPSFPQPSCDTFEVAGIIGCDLFDRFSVFELCDCAGGKVVRLANGFIPVGPLDGFVTSKPCSADTNVLLNLNPHYPQKPQFDMKPLINGHIIGEEEPLEVPLGDHLVPGMGDIEYNPSVPHSHKVIKRNLIKTVRS